MDVLILNSLAIPMGRGCICEPSSEEKKEIGRGEESGTGDLHVSKLLIDV